MSSGSGSLALVLSIVALAVAGYGMLEDDTPPATDVDARLASLEDQLGRMERRLGERGVTTDGGPTLHGLGGDARPTGAASRSPSPGATPPRDAPAREDASAAAGKSPEELAALVDEAVEKKARQIQVMRDKKPSIDVFAETLALSDVQRKAAAEDIVRAQQDIKAILEIPTDDGTNLMEELVDVMAHGIAEPGKNPERGIQFFGRLLTEKVPGTDDTYAARVEAVKQGVRDAFKRNWTEKQYAAFETWRMDPTEVKDIEGSPWKPLEQRILDRARRLGAEIPEPAEGR